MPISPLVVPFLFLGKNTYPHPRGKSHSLGSSINLPCKKKLTKGMLTFNLDIYVKFLFHSSFSSQRPE